MDLIIVLLLVIAVVLFLLEAFAVRANRVNLGWLGLASFALAELLQHTSVFD